MKASAAIALVITMWAIPQCLARMVQVVNLHWALPKSDKVVIGQVTRIEETEEEQQLGHPLHRHSTFKRNRAHIRVIHPFKNSRTNEQLVVSYIAGAAGFLEDPPHFFEPERKDAAYLMFLRQREDAKAEYVALTDPYDSQNCLIELRSGSEGLELAKLFAEDGKSEIKRIAKKILNGEMDWEAYKIEGFYRLVEFYDQLALLVDGIQRANSSAVTEFREHVIWVEQYQKNFVQSDGDNEGPGPGWKTDYPYKSYWWYEPKEE